MTRWIVVAVAVLLAVFALPAGLGVFLVTTVLGVADPCVSPTAGPLAGASTELRLPLTGSYSVTSGFGSRVHPVTGRRTQHNGLDLAMSPHGGPVLAMAAGSVAGVSAGGAGGNVVVLDHGDGLQSKYLHLARVLVAKGDHVGPGQQIGVEGATGRVTGPHLHWEIWVAGKAVDPASWAPAHGLSLDGHAPAMESVHPGVAHVPLPASRAIGSPPTAAAQSAPAAVGAQSAAPLPSRIGRWQGEQLRNAGHIITAGKALGLDDWTITVGVMTAMGESGLVNVDRGDAAGPDSRGLFQQRANGAWGSYADRMNPDVAATNFFRALVAVPGFHDLPPTLAAHRTQRNADPLYYQRYWAQAVEVVAGLTADPTLLASLPDAGQAVGCGTAGDATGSSVPPGPQGDCPVTTSPAERGLQADALRGLRCGAQVFPQVHTFYGVGSRAGTSDHPAGRAVDFMIDGYRTPAGRAVGWQLAEWMRANAGSLGVTYIIFDLKIWTVAQADAGWRPYTRYGPAPDDTLAHRNHVHVSFR